LWHAEQAEDLQDRRYKSLVIWHEEKLRGYLRRCVQTREKYRLGSFVRRSLLPAESVPWKPTEGYQSQQLRVEVALWKGGYRLLLA